MKSLFDLFAIASGLIGLGGLVFHGAPLTPENASMQGARAIIVVAFVVIPYFMARAVEKFDLKVQNKQTASFFKRPVVNKAEQVPLDTLFFDYFFKPVTSPDWQSPTMIDRPKRELPDDSHNDE